MSIKVKLIVALVAATAAIAVVIAAVVERTAEAQMRAAAERSVRDAGEAFASMERADVEKLSAAIRALDASRELKEAFAARDREKLLALAAPIFAGLEAEHDVTHWYFHDPEPARTNFLRVHKPAQFGDEIKRKTLSLSIESKGVGAGKELGKTAFALRVVRPYQLDGKLVGYLELGEEIDHFLGRMKAQTGDEYGLLLAKAKLDAKAWAESRQGRPNTWDAHANVVVANATTADEGVLAFPGDPTGLPEGGKVLEQLERDGKTLVRGIVPVEDAAGAKVGGLVVLHDITALRASMLEARTTILWVIAGAGLLLVALGWVLVQGLVFGRLDKMIATMEDASMRLAGGDYDVTVPPPASGDEIGRFEKFFGGFVAVISGLLKELTGTPGGDRKTGS